MNTNPTSIEVRKPGRPIVQRFGVLQSLKRRLDIDNYNSGNRHQGKENISPTDDVNLSQVSGRPNLEVRKSGRPVSQKTGVLRSLNKNMNVDHFNCEIQLQGNDRSDSINRMDTGTILWSI